MTETYDFQHLMNEAKQGGALPAGDYDVEVVSAEAVRASTGSPMVKVKLRVLSGQFANRPVYNNHVLTTDNPNALNFFFRQMKAWGLDASFFAQIGQGPLDPVAAALVGRRAKVTLGQRQWNGSTQNELKNIQPFAGVGPGAAVAPPSPAAASNVVQFAAPGTVPPPPAAPPVVQQPVAAAVPPPPPPPAPPTIDPAQPAASVPAAQPAAPAAPPAAAPVAPVAEQAPPTAEQLAQFQQWQAAMAAQQAQQPAAPQQSPSDLPV